MVRVELSSALRVHWTASFTRVQFQGALLLASTLELDGLTTLDEADVTGEGRILQYPINISMHGCLHSTTSSLGSNPIHTTLACQEVKKGPGTQCTAWAEELGRKTWK